MDAKETEQAQLRETVKNQKIGLWITGALWLFCTFKVLTMGGGSSYEDSWASQLQAIFGWLPLGAVDLVIFLVLLNRMLKNQRKLDPNK